jgi:hypothetical protein
LTNGSVKGKLKKALSGEVHEDCLLSNDIRPTLTGEQEFISNTYPGNSPGSMEVGTM